MRARSDSFCSASSRFASAADSAFRGGPIHCCTSIARSASKRARSSLTRSRSRSSRPATSRSMASAPSRSVVAVPCTTARKCCSSEALFRMSVANASTIVLNSFCIPSSAALACCCVAVTRLCIVDTSASISSLLIPPPLTTTVVAGRGAGMGSGGGTAGGGASGSGGGAAGRSDCSSVLRAARDDSNAVAILRLPAVSSRPSRRGRSTCVV